MGVQAMIDFPGGIRFLRVMQRCFYSFLVSGLVAVVVLGMGLPSARAETAGLPAVVKDVAYKSGAALSAYETERCKLDLHLPAGGVRDFPTLVWFHGGALTAGVKDDSATTGIARHFAAAGVAMASVNYRLSPRALYPAYVEDAAAAFAWVKQHITEYGGKADRVFIGGHSAGGYLALMVGLDGSLLKAHGLELPAIAGVIPVAGQTLTHYTIREERGLPKDRLLADGAAPVNHVSKEAPPMLILYAENDMAMRAEENQLLAAALRNTGHPAVTLRMIPGSDHGSVGHDLAKAENPGFGEILKFLQAAGR